MLDSNFLNIWLERLTDLLVPHLLQGFKNLYGDAKKIHKHQPLKLFQMALERIPDLAQSKLETDYRVLLKKQNCTDKKLHQIIKAIFGAHAKLDLMGHGAPNNLKIKERDLNIPDNITFLHKCYIESARSIWTSPDLFSDKYDSIRISKNYNLAEEKIKDAIRKTVRKLIPFEQLQYRYLEESVSSQIGGRKEKEKRIDKHRERGNRGGENRLGKLLEKEHRNILDLSETEEKRKFRKKPIGRPYRETKESTNLKESILSERRSKSDPEHRSKSDPDFEHRSKSDPDFEHRSKSDPDFEHRSKSEGTQSDFEHRSKSDPLPGLKMKQKTGPTDSITKSQDSEEIPDHPPTKNNDKKSSLGGSQISRIPFGPDSPSISVEEMTKYDHWPSDEAELTVQSCPLDQKLKSDYQLEHNLLFSEKEIMSSPADFYFTKAKINPTILGEWKKWRELIPAKNPTQIQKLISHLESELEATLKEQSKKDESNTSGSKSEKSEKTESDKTEKTKSEKSEKTESEKTEKTKSEKSEKTKSEKSEKTKSEKSKSEKSKSNKSESKEGQADKGQADEGQADKGQTNEGQADKGQADESQADEGQADESQADESKGSHLKKTSDELSSDNSLDEADWRSPKGKSTSSQMPKWQVTDRMSPIDDLKKQPDYVDDYISDDSSHLTTELISSSSEEDKKNSLSSSLTEKSTQQSAGRRHSTPERYSTPERHSTPEPEPEDLSEHFSTTVESDSSERTGESRSASATSSSSGPISLESTNKSTQPSHLKPDQTLNHRTVSDLLRQLGLKGRKYDLHL